jgi:hypothetical protein
MVSKRVENYEARDSKEVSYWKTEQGSFLVYFPLADLLGNLAAHTITEHEDGTITVTPSILVTAAWRNARVHGYLTRGEWKDC